MCGYSNKHGNKIGQVTYDRFFSNSVGYQPQNGSFTAPSEGIYLVNFYTHIDTGISTMENKQDYYSAYIRYQEGGEPELLFY